MYGINVGSLNTSISNLSESSIQMVLSETSKRTFPTLISFTEKERLFGDSAAFSIKSNCERSLFSPSRFLTLDTEEILKEHQYSPLNKLNSYSLANINNNNSKRGKNSMDELFFQLQKGMFIEKSQNNNQNNRDDLTGEFSYFQVNAGFFTKINDYLNKQLSNKGNLLDNKVGDQIENNKLYYTISVPDYFTLQERNRLMDCLRISTISNIKLQNYQENDNQLVNKSNSLLSSQKQREVFLLNESSAITLFYGFNRRKELASTVKSEKNPRQVCFVDIGNSKTTIIFSSFTANNFKVESVTTERFLGARNMDIKVANRVLDQFIVKNKLTLKPGDIKLKQYYRLLECASNARKTLTVNEESTISIESFFGDLDISYCLKRADFEDIIKDEVLLFKNLLEIAVINYSNKLNIEPNKLLKNTHSVEMAGDALRIPILQSIVEETFKLKLSKTLSPDELISKGACIFSITQSKKYSLNYDFLLTHFCGFEINIKFNVRREKYIQNNESNYWLNYNLIKKDESLPSRKVYKISNPYEVIEFHFSSGNDLISKSFKNKI